MKPLISAIIVHWNTATELGACIRSIIDSKEISIEAIVVDNASVDIDSLPWSEYPDSVRLIRNKENYGYARATNQGLKEARGDFVLFLNPDVVANSQGLKALAGAIESNPSCGAAVARLNLPDGSFQRYCLRFPTVAAMIGRRTVLEPFFREARFVKRYLMHDMDPEKSAVVEQAPGACLMLSRQLLEKTGGMDERFPLFFNDVDFCRRIIVVGGSIIYTPDAVFTHASQASVRKVAPEQIRAEFTVSMIRYFAKWRPGAAHVFLKAAMRADHCARLLAAKVRVALGKKSAADMRKIVEAYSMVVSGASMFERPRGRKGPTMD